MQQGDLTTLANVKAWLNIANTVNDALLSSLISRLSSAIRTHINRYSLVSQQFNEKHDGSGTQMVVLSNWPVTEVFAVKVGSATLPQGRQDDSDNGPIAGWYLSPYDGNPPGNAQVIELVGYAFQYGKANVTINYQAGYRISGETYTVASPDTYTALQPKGIWAADNGVKYALTGIALTSVTGAPGQGEYALDANVQGGYIFSAADAGAALLIDYSYVPFDLEQACIEWVSERYSYRSRIGLRSKSLAAQETVTYNLAGVPDFIAAILMPYTSVLPVLS